MKGKSILTAAAAETAMLTIAGAVNAGILDDVKKKGFLQCGVSTGVMDFSAPNDKGKWEGFDVDMCRAVGAVGINAVGQCFWQNDEMTATENDGMAECFWLRR